MNVRFPSHLPTFPRMLFFLSSQPLLFHSSHSVPLHTPPHYNDTDKKPETPSCQIPGHCVVLTLLDVIPSMTLSLVFNIPLSWDSSPTALFLLYLLLRISSSKNTLNAVLQVSPLIFFFHVIHPSPISSTLKTPLMSPPAAQTSGLNSRPVYSNDHWTSLQDGP